MEKQETIGGFPDQGTFYVIPRQLGHMTPPPRFLENEETLEYNALSR